MLVLRKRAALRATLADRRTRLAARRSPRSLITVNWGTYIYGVNSHHVVETSLGYFINPLVIGAARRGRAAASGCAGCSGWRSRIAGVGGARADRRVRPAAVDLAGAGVLASAATGWRRRRPNAGAVESLVVETLVVSPLALGYIVFLMATGASTFGSNGAGARRCWSSAPAWSP